MKCRLRTINGWCGIFNKPCKECISPTCEFIKKAYRQGRVEAEYFGYHKIDWIPVSERLPEDLEEVVVTWVNRNPPVYYRHEKDKPQTGFAVLYRDTWHWWDSTIVDVLAEYGLRCGIEHI